LGEKSSIEWTNASWTPIRGVKGKWSCIKVSPGCQFCYAERLNQRFGGPAYTVGADELHLDEKVLTEPLRWKRPRKIFVCSMTDLFEERVSIEWIARVFNVMACATVECGKRHRHEDECWTGPPHTFQILTKRAERMHGLIEELPNYVGEHWPGDAALSIAMDVHWPLPNVWLGVSAEDQQRADERIPLLLQTPAAVRFVSLEPLLGSIDLLAVPAGEIPGYAGLRLRDKLHWVIVGGESGGPPERALVEKLYHAGYDRSIAEWSSKPEALEWVRSIRDQSVAAGVPLFFKQWGGPTPKSGGRMLDGRTWDQYPG